MLLGSFSSLIIFPLSLCGIEASLDLGSGYRQDNFNWNISGGESGPNVLSELKWKDLKMWEVYTKLKMTLPCHFYIRLHADYGRICKGKNSDTDFLGNHKTQPFSLSYSKANKGEVFDFSFGLAYLCNFFHERLKIAPLLGFSMHEQHLRMIHGNVVLDLFDPLMVGSLPDLHNNYRARWYGPWMGLDVVFTLGENLELFATYEYHWAKYDGTGHWNLRTDFLDDFKHTGIGTGSLFSLGGFWNFCTRWNVGVTFQYQIMRVCNGEDRVFFSDSKGRTSASTRLNRVNWDAFSSLVNLRYCY